MISIKKKMQQNEAEETFYTSFFRTYLLRNRMSELSRS
jgi:hypothetical protein